MPHYLFTNDNRISDFPDRLIKSARNIRENKNFDYSTAEGKSEGNVTATNGFYFNLKPGSETLVLAETNPKACIRNFVLKFQYPNARERNEYGLELADKIQLAPYRIVARILVQIGYFHGEPIPRLSQAEILYYIFGNKDIYQNKTSDYEKIITQIYQDRTKGISNYDLTDIRWKQMDRQIREMMKFLNLACNAFSYDKGILSFDKSKMSNEDKDAEFISQLLNYNQYWNCPNVPFSIANESYSKYMDIDKDWRAPYLVIKNDLENIHSDEELSKILSDNFDSSRKVAICNLFGLRYGETLSDYDRKRLTNLVKTSGILKSPEDSENSLVDYIINGRNIYDGIKNGDLGLRFYNEKLEEGQDQLIQCSTDKAFPIQVIYYGAPGTGKSYGIKEIVGTSDGKEESPIKDDNNIRITFHPDTDYASFVGCYKPMRDEYDPKLIVYKYQPQAFVKAYVNAWTIYLDDLTEDKKYYLIIEEINRGNCAQIFGDMFQLLDREDSGYSSYKVSPDSDLQMYLEEAFKDVDFSLEEDGEELKEGRRMQLPPNLSILATMNTSDQSLFPMDSAFKRRWDWDYVKIDTDKVEDLYFKVGDSLYSWADFVNSINKYIQDNNGSTAKQIGPWFAKADDDEVDGKPTTISYDKFCSKVLFYLFNDALRDFDPFGTLFQTKDDDDSVNFFFENLFEKEDKGVANVEHFLEELPNQTGIKIEKKSTEGQADTTDKGQDD